MSTTEIEAKLKENPALAKKLEKQLEESLNILKFVRDTLIVEEQP